VGFTTFLSIELRAVKAMKFARYIDADGEHWGAVDLTAGTIRRIAGPFAQWAPAVTSHGSRVLEYDRAAPVPLEQAKILAPLSSRSEILWVGLNYPNWPRPTQSDPPIFLKPLTAMIGPEQTIRFPRLIRFQTQSYFCYEIELVAVIGSVRIADPAHGTRDVLGYTVGNGGALRNLRLSGVGHDVMSLKSSRASSAIGPWITTKDELGGEGQVDLHMTMRVNSAVTQRGRTGNMIWSLDKLINEVDHRARLTCGDVIYTGTCGYEGVPDGVYKPGDVVEAHIDGIGTLRNQIEEQAPYCVSASQIWDGSGVPSFYPAPRPESAL
jgi:2-keto-4-pentenoate hydratase/2-oxohepta-3-ene-1,7-dioic acid hydratase in catechol pathway